MYVGRYILRVHYLCQALTKTGTSQKSWWKSSSMKFCERLIGFRIVMGCNFATSLCGHAEIEPRKTCKVF